MQKAILGLSLILLLPTATLAEDDRNYLYQATIRDDANAVRQLLAKGIKPDGGGYDFLIKATQDGKQEMVRLLLNAGAKVDAKDDKTRTALMYAAMAGNIEIAEFLLAKGANANARNDYPYRFNFHGTSPHKYSDNLMSALMYAAQAGHIRMVELLIAKGAKVNAKTYYDETALMYAAEKGHEDIVRILIKQGADLYASADDKEKKREANAFGQSYGGTALLYATRSIQPVTAKVLLAEYIRRNKPIEEAEKIFSSALFAKDLDLVKTLSENGIDTRKPLFLGTAAYFSTFEIFKFLLDKVADDDFRNGKLSPGVLIGAASSGDLAKVKLVVERGANINALNGSGQNALYYARSSGATEVVNYLLAKKSEVNVAGNVSLGWNGMGDTPLALAVQKGGIEDVKQLLDNGADIHLKREHGKSALDVANELGRTDVLLLFVTSGRLPITSLPIYLRDRTPYQNPEAIQPDVLYRSGEKLYATHCSGCHGKEGIGYDKRVSLRQEGMQGKSKQSLITVVLQGGKLPNTVPMEEYQSKLLDVEVAALLTYISNAWGNKLGQDYQPQDVQAMRATSPTRTQNALIRNNKKTAAIIQQLIKLGYLYSESLFVESVRKNDQKAVELFLAAGMNPAAKDAKGETALAVAAYTDNGEVLGILLDQGVDIHLKNAPWGVYQTAPMAALTFCRGKSQAMRVMLDKGLDPNLRQSDLTLLMTAAMNGCSETAQLLIDRGADVNARQSDGSTALKLAKIYSGKKDIVPILLTAGAKE